MNCEALIRTLDREHRLSGEEWERLFTEYTPEDADFAIELARQRTLERFGRKIWFRGIVEFSNICKCDCHYCGIRCSNHQVSRYRLSPEDIFQQNMVSAAPLFFAVLRGDVGISHGLEQFNGRNLACLPLKINICIHRLTPWTIL